MAEHDYDRTNYSPADILRYAEYDLVIGYRSPALLGAYDPATAIDYSDIFFQDMQGAMTTDVNAATLNATAVISTTKTLHRFKHDNRLIGVVNGINEDESFDITILGSDLLDIRSNSRHKIFEMNTGITSREDILENPDKYNFPSTITWIPRQDEQTHFCYAYADVSGRYITLDDSFDYTPEWYSVNAIPSDFYNQCCTINGGSIPEIGKMQLTNNPNTSLRMGIGEDYPFPFTSDYNLRLGKEIYEGMAGDLFTALFNNATYYINQINGMPVLRTHADLRFYVAVWGHAFMWKPYNLILTESVQQAQEYLSTGRLPSDAWIYPWDPDTFPEYTPDTPPSGGDDDNPPETHDPTKDLPQTPHETMTVTPQALTNNNLYWLQAGQLSAFINWFWLDAGTILDAGDLWDKLKGLYNDLASAVLNVRFMPVDELWIGGTSNVSSIIVGQIEMPAQVKKINKANPLVRSLGSVDIKKINKDFTDFSPYCELQLYLPYHGFMSLDNDILEGETLSIECVYDIISGTIQYMIYCNQTLLNTCVCKMAVDIPITLQSKNDRDSAIFNNVANVTGNLIGAGASFGMGVATGNPAGMVMATMQGANALTGGKQTAPLKAYGSVGETGAFYCFGTPFVLVKHAEPQYPSIYGSRIGYPSNKVATLRTVKGFTVVAEPRIQFTGNKYDDEGTTVYMKPTQTEIDEIYSYLRKGVIL